jgi:glutamine synthetase
VYVVPVYKTAFLNPFDEGSLDFICRYLMPDGSRAPFALDNILHNAHDFIGRSTGYELHALGELEFFLLYDPTQHLYPSEKQHGYHASAPFTKAGPILNEMVYHITRLSGAVKYGHCEVGVMECVRSDLEEIKGKQAEQLEIEFLPAPIEDMGDALVLARWLIRNTAYKHGCVATFTPKLEEGIAGNGLHVHLELRRNGRNAMVNEDGRLSPQARQLIGGLCTYADSLTAFGNTVSSAYLRLVPNQEAPTRICWSDMNRSAMIRVPLGWSQVSHLAGCVNPQQPEGLADTESRQTVELRSPDGSALIHLLLAGLTLAAQWGLSHPAEAQQIADELYVTGNIFHNKELLSRLAALPTSCEGSAEILLQKRQLYERENIFPASTLAYVADLLKAEKDANMNSTLADLPADDRLHATRRIMHKDLHRH